MNTITYMNQLLTKNKVLFLALCIFSFSCKKEINSSTSSIVNETTEDKSTAAFGDAKTIYLNATTSDGGPVFRSVDVATLGTNWDFVPVYTNPTYQYLNNFENVPLFIDDTIVLGGPNMYEINKNTGTFWVEYGYIDYNGFLGGIRADASPAFDDARRKIIFSPLGNLISLPTGIFNAHPFWERSGPGVLAGPPVYKDNKIFVNNYSGYYSDGRRVAALDAKTGNVIWMYNADNQFVSSSVCVANNTVFTVDKKAVFYALNANTGALIWKQQHGTSIGGGSNIMTHITYNNDKIYVVTSDVLRCIDAATGDEIWSKGPADGMDFYADQVCVSKGKVFVTAIIGSKFRFCCFDQETGNLLWKNSEHQYTVMSPVETGGIVYMSYINSFIPPYDEGLVGLNVYTGHIVWSYPLTITPKSITVETNVGSIVYPVDSGEKN